MPTRSVAGQRVTVVGAARSGVAAARLLARHGANVFVTDSGTASADAEAKLRDASVDYELGGHSARAEDADFIVKSPGVPDKAPFMRMVHEQGMPVYSEIEVGAWFCEAPIVAITGSNGKTTTTSLTGHTFRTGGRKVLTAGNIGDAFSDHADRLDPETTVVLEVSSFQLDHIDAFRPRVSVILNITPDHLDRYDHDFSKYAASKCRIFENQGAGDALIYNIDDPVLRDRIGHGVPVDVQQLPISLDREVPEGAFLRGREIIIRFNQIEEVIMPFEELTLRGRHNLYNSLAASMAARFLEVSDEMIRESMRTFEGVPHRLEFVREVDGVRFVNDSKATNVNAVWYALESFDEKIVLIAGGLDKGNDYDEIRPLVTEKVRGMVLIGTGADKLEADLSPHVSFTVRANSMDEAVRLANEKARDGEIVLLSPACASFDMFQNFEHRGEAFRSAVMSLESNA